jgi:hypothetical protein
VISKIRNVFKSDYHWTGDLMGKYVKRNHELVYQQDDGEITAWLPICEEIMALSHEGTPLYKRVFYLLVIVGLIYLFLIFSV